MNILETERLLLRHFVPEDLPELYALYSDPVVRRFFPEGTLSLDETGEELEWFLGGHPRHPELGLWATIYKPTAQFIGRCGLLPWTIDGVFEVEIAYMLAQAWWGQGLATEAALGIREYAYETLNLSRLICLIDAGNQASIRVATKIGMQFEKTGFDDKGPYVLYSVQRPTVK